MKPLHVTVGLCLGFVALVVGLFVYSVMRTPTLTEEQLRREGVLLLPTPRELPTFALTTADGKPFSRESLTGAWSFLFFGFTNCPDVCPTSMSVMGQAYRSLEQSDPEAAREFRGYLVSVDPERDTADKLERYVSAFSEDFTGVRGELKELASFATGVNVAFAKVPGVGADGGPNGSSYLVDHTANIVIVNPRGHYHGFIKYPQQADTIAAAFQTLRANF